MCHASEKTTAYSSDTATAHSYSVSIRANILTAGMGQPMSASRKSIAGYVVSDVIMSIADRINPTKDMAGTVRPIHETTRQTQAIIFSMFYFIANTSVFIFGEACYK